LTRGGVHDSRASKAIPPGTVIRWSAPRPFSMAL
jgi:hypothetical protein